MIGDPEIEYHIWHTPEGEIRGVGHIAVGAPRGLGAIPLAPEHPGLRVTTITMSGVADPRLFERKLVKDGRLIDREPTATE